VRSIGQTTTLPSPYGKLHCKTNTGEGSDIGTLTGVSSGQATLDLNAIVICDPITVRMTGTYVITAPGGLGVTS
jgi:hypothetical protein